MAFQEYEEITEPLRLPIKGKLYTIPPVSVKVGLLLNGIAAGTESIEGMPEVDQWRLVLGSALDEMIADDVPKEAVERAALTATADVTAGRVIAERVWEAGIDPNFRAAMITAALEKSLTTLPNTEVESATPSPESMSGTNSPQATKPRKSAARNSRGPRSARSGD